MLTTWLLDLRSARQLGLATTGHAARGTSSPPAPGRRPICGSNPARSTPQALIADIDSGFYVTELMGMGVNGITGDYSRGAAGFWIEKGEIAFPVSEMTVAGNLKDMFAAAGGRQRPRIPRRRRFADPAHRRPDRRRGLRRKRPARPAPALPALMPTD